MSLIPEPLCMFCGNNKKITSKCDCWQAKKFMKSMNSKKFTPAYPEKLLVACPKCNMSMTSRDIDNTYDMNVICPGCGWSIKYKELKR